MSHRIAVMACLLLDALCAAAHAAELVTLTTENFDEYAPHGKEADAIIGDYVLRNDKIVAVVADPELLMGRSASRWSIPNVAGALIDLTTRDHQNDVLTAFYPAKLRYKPDAPNYQEELIPETEAHKQPGREPQQGKRVVLKTEPYQTADGKMLKWHAAQPEHLRGAPEPFYEVNYILEDGWDYIEVEVIHHNPTKKSHWPYDNMQLRADGGYDIDRALDNRLVTIYDHDWRQAYGILSDGPSLSFKKPDWRQATTLHAKMEGGGKGGPRLMPGKSMRFTRKIFPGRNLFDVKAIAADLLEMPLRPLTIHARSPQGPVSGATVTLADAKGNVWGQGKTGRDGSLSVRVPTIVDQRITVSSIAHGSESFTPRRETETIDVDLESPALVDLHIAQGDDPHVPFKVRVTGVDGTPDPDFFPASGEVFVRNLMYLPGSAAGIAMPPGKYAFLITRGPEYEPISKTVTLERGKTTRIEGRLERVVDTTGYIAADFHNHSTISGRQDLFYVYPYVKNPSTEGDSASSTRGRVLNLLCEGIEFAVPTEHNFIADYGPLVKQVGGEQYLATVPGIGLTAGRRHTLSHQNVFPVTHIPGRQDGGVLQRPEHVGQHEWMLDWDDRAEKAVIIVQPWGDPLGVKPGMDALDIVNLEPLIEQKLIPDVDNRAIEWLELLNKGYRLPAVVNPHSFDNFHGSGGKRNYVQSPTDDPSAIKPLDIVHAIEQGKVIMTTGPMMRVNVSDDAGDKNASAVTEGGNLRSESGKVAVDVKLQTHSRMTIDRIQVLVNGERAAEFSPPSSSDSPRRFENTFRLALDRDSHIIVVASGTGENLRGGKAKTRTHVAVSNPVWVDVADEGYSPHSPLDDAVHATLQFIEAPLAAPGHEPGRVRLSLKNRGSAPASDDATLVAYPDGAMRIVGPATQSYSLPHAGSETTIDYRLEFTEAYLRDNFPVISTYNSAGRFGVRVGRSGKYPGRRPAGNFMHVDHHVGSIAPISKVADVPAALEGQVIYPVRHRMTRQIASMRFAVAGNQLAITADVKDDRIVRRDIVWEGSCVEVFACMPGRHPDNLDIKPGGWYPSNQVYLAPAVGDQPAAAFIRRDDKIVPAPSIHVTSTPTDDGYQLAALIPLSDIKVDVDVFFPFVYVGSFTDVSLLGLEARPGRFLLEARVTAAEGRLKGTIFGSPAPHVDSHAYGRMRPVGKVHGRLEVLRHLPPTKDDPPGRVRMTLRNDSDDTASDTAALAIKQSDQAMIVGDGKVTYTLEPHEEKSWEFDVALKPGASPNYVNVVLPRSPGGEIIAVPSPRMKLGDRPIAAGPALGSVDEVKQTFANEKAFDVQADGDRIASVRFAIAGDALALHATVIDSKVSQHQRPWKASDIEVFGSDIASDKIGQIFLQPAAGDASAKALVSSEGAIKPSDAIKVTTTLTDTGYELSALIPLETIAIDPAAKQLKFEVQVCAHDTNGKLRYGTVFGSPRAYQDNTMYGRFEKR